MGKRPSEGISEGTKQKRPRKRIIIYSSDEESDNASTSDIEPTAGPSHGRATSQNGSRVFARPMITPEPPSVAVVTQTAPENETASPSVTDADMELDEDLLLLLGDAPEPETTMGKAIHKDVSARWMDIIKKGLSKDLKDKLEKEYPIPSNCELLVPPLLNPEAKAALTETFVKRDASLMYRQKQISVAMAALAQAVDGIILNKDDQELKQKILKPVNDACRILCDLYQNETKIRRKFVISSINTGMKETLANSGTDKYLFGDNMSEKLKAAKNVQKSGEALKIPQKSVFHKSNFYKYKTQSNFKPLHQRTAGKQDAGKTVPAPRYQSGSSRAQDRAPNRSSPRPPPPTRRTTRR